MSLHTVTNNFLSLRIFHIFFAWLHLSFSQFGFTDMRKRKTVTKKVVMENLHFRDKM